jgi:dTMP kinase
VRGAFITFEGGEGAGKSTQARRLAQRLRARGGDVVLTREPGGSPFAERLRNALLGESGRTLDATEQAIMFAAARCDHVDTVIAPALEEGRTVICDRFSDSTAAYQGTSGASEEILKALDVVAVGQVKPDLTIILDLPPEEGLRRARSRQVLNLFEEDALSKHEARRAAFLRIAALEPRRCIVLDATRPADDLAARILALVEERFPALAGA